MSNLFKSKFLLGALIVAVMLVGVVAVATSANATNCTITSTLRVGMRNAQVTCLQTNLGVSPATGYFGTKTKAAVVAWQKTKGLTADGIFGAKSRAAFAGGTVSTTLPTGCTSTAGFSSTTGQSCATGVMTTTYPAGCTSAAGFSPTTGASCATGAVNNQTGPVTVQLSSDTPASGYIIANQATADLLHFTFMGSGTVNSVVLQRTGVSDQNTLTNVYLYNGATRLTDGYSFNNSGQLTMNGLAIAVNGSTTISVKADVANATASSLGISLIGFTAAGNAATTVNVMGNQMTYGTGSLATVYLDAANQSVALGCTVGTNCPTVNAGTTAYTIWSSPMQVNTRAIWLKGANFRIVGSAPADALANIKLYVDGQPAGTATMGSINGTNYAMLDFSSAPVSLTTGSHTLDLRADIVKGSSYTVQVSLQQVADLVLFDGQLGVNIAVTKNSSTAYATSTAGTITINAGSASVNVDPAFQTLTTVTGGATNAVIARFKVHGYGEDVKVTSIDVLPVITGMTPSAAGLCAADLQCGLNNLTVYFNGAQVGSSYNWRTAVHTFTLGSQMVLPAGSDSFIEIRADIQTAGSVNYTAGYVSANINVGATNAQGQTSHTTLNFPASTVNGTILTVQSGAFAVSKNASYLSQVVNANVANVKIGSFTLQNQSSSEGIRVNNLQVAIAFPAATTLTGSTSTTNTTGTQTWNLNQTAALAGITAGNVLTVAANAGCTTVPVMTVLSVSGSALTSTGSGNTASAGGNCTDGTAVVAVSPTSGPATITNLSNLRTSETSGSGSTPVQPTATNNFSVNMTLLPGETRTVDVFADLGAANMGTITVSLSTTAVGATSNVTVLQNGTPGTAVPGQVITLGSGSLGLPAIVSSSTSSSQFVAAGTTTGVTDISRASYNIVATNGNATITELKFDNLTGTTGGITAVRVGSVTASMVSNIAYLTGLSIPVANGGAGATIDAYASYPPVGTTGIASLSTGVLRLCYIKYTIGGSTTTVGSAACGGSTASYPVTSGATMTLVGSKPVVTVTQPSGVLLSASSSIEAIDVTITADAAGPIKVVSFPITATMTGASGTANNFTAADFVVKDSGNNTISTITAGSNCGATASCVNVTVTLNSTAGYLINAGQSQTFKVFIPTGVGVTGGTGNLPNIFLNTSVGGSGVFSFLDVAGSNSTAITGVDRLYNYPSTFTSIVHN